MPTIPLLHPLIKLHNIFTFHFTLTCDGENIQMENFATQQEKFKGREGTECPINAGGGEIRGAWVTSLSTIHSRSLSPAG